MKVRKCVQFSQKMLRCKARARYTTEGISYHSLIDPRATSEAPEDATQGVYRLSHAIYSVVSPRQTLRELARDYKLNPAHQLCSGTVRVMCHKF